MQYRWKLGARAPVAAQVAGEVCERLSADGRLTPHELVEVSRPEDAPLHKAFEWDDAKAASAYRESQAAYIIRSVEVKREDMDEPIRAFFTVPTTSGQSYQYQSVEAILRDADSHDALLDAAKRELDSFTRKYRNLAELAEIITAAEKLLGAA